MRPVYRPCGHHSVRAGEKPRRFVSPALAAEGGLPLSEIKIQNSSEFSRKRGTKFTLSMESRRSSVACQNKNPLISRAAPPNGGAAIFEMRSICGDVDCP